MAWADTVQENIQHRVGLQAAPLPHADTCHKVLASFQPWEQKILLRHFAGGYMSGSEKDSWSREHYAACPLCGQRDTKAHRIFECPVLANARAGHEPLLSQVLQQCPHWPHMTFASLPVQAELLQLLLQGLRLPPLAPAAPAGRRLCLFTDGSGMHARIPLARLVTWAVILADPTMCTAIANQEPGAQERGFTVLATGCVPGDQTVPRAELCALLWASSWVDQNHGAADIYVDCQPAIDSWSLWCREGYTAVRQKANADLFADLRPPVSCKVHKVKAHQSSAEWLAAPEWDRWLACGNEAADTAAKAAYQDLPDLLRSTADAVASHCTEQSTLLKGFCKALVAVGLQDIKFRASAKAAAVVRPGPAEQDVATFLARFSNWQPPSGACRLPDHLEVDWVGWTFGVAFGDKLLDWLQVVKWPDQPVPPEFSGDISYMELLFHFTWFTRSPPPVPRHGAAKCEYLPLDQALRELLPCPTSTLVNVFRAALKQLGRRYRFQPLPCSDIKNVVHLQCFGVAAPSPGVALRPELPGNWLEAFRWTCEGDVAHRLGTFCEA